jgi:hypothetical protein
MATVHDTDRPISEILKNVGDDLGRLVRGEIALLKTEVRENTAKIGAGAGLFGGAGVVGLFALQFLLLAVVFGLIDAGIRPWLAAVIVAGVLGIVAAVLAMTGKKKVAGASLAPTETIEQVKTDAAAIRSDVQRLRRG